MKGSKCKVRIDISLMFIFFSLEVKIYCPFLQKSMKKWANVQMLNAKGNKCPNQLILSGKNWSSLCLTNLLYHQSRVQTCNNLACWGHREKRVVSSKRTLFSLVFIHSLLCFEQEYCWTGIPVLKAIWCLRRWRDMHFPHLPLIAYVKNYLYDQHIS